MIVKKKHTHQKKLAYTDYSFEIENIFLSQVSL